MKAYADTGFLVSLHSRDANSDRAIARMESHTVSIAWTWLHDLEFKNAIRLQVFRKMIKPADIQRIMHDQALDVQAGIYLMAAPALSAVAREAERLSELYTETLGNRSLDVLHVAHALTLGAKIFLTFDLRQGALADAAGLKVPKL
jgi:hypothetical protein